MKVWLDRDERWPDYVVFETKHYASVEFEMTTKEYENYRKVAKEYGEWQKKLQKEWEASRARMPPKK